MFTKNKKYFCTAALLMLIMVATITSCKDDDEATQSYNFLEAFGPCPVARGGELTFVGKDLSSVQSVEFPGGETVTPTFLDKGKFTVIVPASAQPGVLILHTTSGDITTVSKIGFSEPVTITKFTPEAQRPGGEVSITGQYLSNATEIAIGQVKIPLQPASDEQQNLFDRYIKNITNEEIKFIVPADAISAELSLVDGQPVVCGKFTVITPKFTSWSKNDGLMPGSAEMVMNGSDLDLISKITFANGTELEASKIKLTATKATFTLPIAAGDGIVTMTTASGVDVEAGKIVTVKPTVSSFGPTNATNPNPYCDESLFIKGTDLGLVKEVILANKTDNEQTVSQFTSQTDTEIQFAIPELTGTSMIWSNEASDNVPNGELFIVTQSGERIKVSTDANKLRIGWANIGTPASYEITAGDKVAMTGCTNTAYMTKVEADGVEVTFTIESKDSYSFAWPLTNPGDNKVLKVYYTNKDDNSNLYGTKFNVAASSKIFITSMPESLNNGSATLIKGGNFGKVTKVTINGAEQTFALKDENTMFINVDGVAKSPAEIVFVAEDASNSFTTKLPVEGLALPVVPLRWGTTNEMEFPFTDGWGPGQCFLPKSAQLSKYVAVGAKMTFKVHVAPSGGQWQINNPSWSAYTTLAEWSNTDQDVDLVLELTDQMVNDYNALNDGDVWIIMQGDGLTINYIDLL